MQNEPDPERLADLGERLAAAKRGKGDRRKTDSHHSQASAAWRMVIELVTGLGIGFGIGYGLDAAFGTLPIFLVLFTLLGFAAGVRVMMRSAHEIQAQNMRAEAREGNNPPGGGQDK